MASLGGNMTPPDTNPKLIFAGIAGAILFATGLFQLTQKQSQSGNQSPKTNPSPIWSLLLFCYSCFLKPHSPGAKGTQQDALESFYAGQASIYDVTRRTLLKGREDMLALVAAQLRAKADKTERHKRVWVDVGGGTGWNIEAMSEFVHVPEFFSAVYLVDFSPSLCKVARERFARLGWTNVKVICEDARKFRLDRFQTDSPGIPTPPQTPASYFDAQRHGGGGADLVTMSYSLSMIPDYYSVIDSLSSLLSPNGIMGVVDFYVQGQADTSFRNYTGGLINRHVNLFSRTFWRAWFDLDRVTLEAGRRDYLEYRFGTVLSANFRNTTLGAIPYYVWLGCHKTPFSSSSLPNEIIERIDALATESPYLLPVSKQGAGHALSCAVERTAPEIRSKAFDAAVQNLSANLPLPSCFYQNHHWRIYYDDQLQKHKQFNDEYIYAFTWEDSRVDDHLLELGPNDVVLAITSAGDNILSYALRSPARIHAIDLNPAQNHLLELKIAAFTALPYEDFWRIFGDGKHADFRSLLVEKLSPHLSSRAFQYWLSNCAVFTSSRGRGLYDTGGSKYAIRSFRWISRVFGCRNAVKQILAAKTLNEQSEIWQSKIRPALLNRVINGLVISSEAFLWAALGVPKNQLAMIENDHANSDAVKGPAATAKATRAHALWHYMVNTLDPVGKQTHISTDNPYYHVCLEGSFSRRCHLEYLSEAAHARLSRPGAFDGLRIHTDEIDEVIARFTPGTLTVAVIMDSMDWFDPGSRAAAQQITRLNRALRMNGRVLLRSSALVPWYIRVFEAHGFVGKQKGKRTPGTLIDRVNMYASCWICTKVDNLPPPTPGLDTPVRDGEGSVRGGEGAELEGSWSLSDVEVGRGG